MTDSKFQTKATSIVNHRGPTVDHGQHPFPPKPFPAHRQPRYEPRARWPRGSPCAGAWALVRGRPGAVLELDVEFQGGRKDLPLVTLRRVA